MIYLFVMPDSQTSTNDSEKTSKKLSPINFSSSESLDIPNIMGSESQTPKKVAVQNEPLPESDVAMASVTIESKRGGNGFRNFVLLGIVLILVIYGVVAYLYYKNTSLKDVVLNTSKPATNLPTPTPSFNAENVIIENGSVVYKLSDTQNNILVDKNTFPTTGITGFARVVVSPNNKMICFESIPPATKPSLFVADATGLNSRIIGSNKSNCLWTKNSDKIIYSGTESGSSNIHVFLYDFNTSIEQNLTKNKLPSTEEDFKIVGLSSDESLLICEYTDRADENKQCQINLESGDFTTL